jgi:hypothetical protein
MAELILNPPSLFGKQNDSHDIPILILQEIRDYYVFVCLMVLNATFNNISVISCLSQVTDKLCHIMLYTSPWSRFELTTSMVICTDSIGSCKSNHHTITAMMAPITTCDDWETLVVIRIRKLQRDKMTKWKKTNNDQQNTTQKAKDRVTRTPLKRSGKVLELLLDQVYVFMNERCNTKTCTSIIYSIYITDDRVTIKY